MGSEIKLSLNSFFEQRKDTSFYVSQMNASAKDIPIGKLLADMDTDNNKNVSADELYSGLVKNYSDSLRIYTIMNKGTSIEESAQEILDKNVIIDEIGEEGIDLNDTIASYSKLLGFDLGAVIDTANKYGMGINLDELSINSLNELLDEIEEISKTEEVQNIIKHGVATYNSYQDGDFLGAIGNGFKTYGNLFSLNFKNEKAAKYTEKVIEAGATNAKRKVRNFLGGDNFFAKGTGKAVEYVVEGVCELVTGVTGNKVVNFFRRLF